MTQTVQDPGTLLVICLGIGIVFVGLICLIIICKVMGAACTALIKEKPAVSAAAVAPAAPVQTVAITNREEFIAAVSAAIAEDMGTDISRIRIHSVRKL